MISLTSLIEYNLILPGFIHHGETRTQEASVEASKAEEVLQERRESLCDPLLVEPTNERRKTLYLYD